MNVIAEDAKVRLQLRKTSAEDTLSLSNCSGKSIGLKDSSSWGDTHLYAGNLYLKKLTNEWNEFSFSFTPNTSYSQSLVQFSQMRLCNLCFEQTKKSLPGFSECRSCKKHFKSKSESTKCLACRDYIRLG